ncbi:MAG: cell wall hydrolase [Oscillospiraceae bacterium]|nr:cell wall hydrolase [Oscillospiraceae bacterium]
MIKKILAAALVLTVLTSAVSVSALAADCFGGGSGVETYVNDDLVTPIESAEIDGLTYASIRSFSVVMGAQSIKREQSTVTVETDELSIVFNEDSRIVKVNDYRYYIADGRCAMVNNTLMAPLGVLCRAFDVDMVTDDETGNVYIATNAGRRSDLTEDDIDLMARLVQAEAGNQCLDGKIGVVNVVLNRVDSGYFPTSISDIIYDSSNGIQFDTAYNGALYNTPSDDCYTAIYEAMEGVNTVGESLFFAATQDCWAAYNRPLVTIIQDHYFYG